MASKPNPSWSQPQKAKFQAIQEATEIAIPYFGPEIPSLDNHTPEQICDDLGVVKVAKKALEQVEKTLSERFKPKMEGLLELRGTRYIATKRPSQRIMLNQGKAKELLERADELGVDLQKILVLVEAGELEGYKPSWTLSTVPGDNEMEEPYPVTNMEQFHTTMDVSALYVEAI